MNQAAGGEREWSGASDLANDINLFMSGGFLAVSDLGWSPAIPLYKQELVNIGSCLPMCSREYKCPH